MYGNLKRGEDTEQMGVIDWTNWNRNRFPELQLIFHIPNGGKRNATEAARFKAMGVKAGVPDLFLPVPKDGYAGLFIEMKYGKNKTTENQEEWIENLKKQGYKVVVCYGGEAATRELEAYMQTYDTILQKTEDLERPHKRIQIICEPEDEEHIRTALSTAVVRGDCIFDEEFNPTGSADCVTCAMEHIEFITR